MKKFKKIGLLPSLILGTIIIASSASTLINHESVNYDMHSLINQETKDNNFKAVRNQDVFLTNETIQNGFNMSEYLQVPNATTFLEFYKDYHRTNEMRTWLSRKFEQILGLRTDAIAPNHSFLEITPTDTSDHPSKNEHSGVVNKNYEYSKKYNDTKGDYSKRTTVDFYNERNDINNKNLVFTTFQIFEGDWENKFGRNASQGNKDLLNKLIAQETLFNPTLGTGGLYKVRVKLTFDNKDFLDINNLDNYMTISETSTNPSVGKKPNYKITFDLFKMRKDFGNFWYLNKKEIVFNRNGLHDYFNVDFETFWNKVIEKIDAAGYDKTKLTKDSFLKTNTITRSSNSTRTKRSTNRIIDHNNNAIVNEQGWIEPTKDLIGELTFESTSSNKYVEADLNNVTSDSWQEEGNSTEIDNVLTETQKSKLNQNINALKNLEMNLGDNINSFNQNDVTTYNAKFNAIKTKLEAFQTEIDKTKSSWSSQLRDVLTFWDENNNIKHSSLEFAPKYIVGWVQKYKEYEDKIKNDLNELDKIKNSQNDSYKNHKFLWLKSNVDLEAKKRAEQLISNIEKTLIERDTALTQYYETGEGKTFLKNVRDNKLYKDQLQTKLDSYRNELNDLNNTLNQEKIFVQEIIDNWTDKNNTSDQDQVKNLASQYKTTIDFQPQNLYKYNQAMDQDAWITNKNDYWIISKTNLSTSNETQYKLFNKLELIKKVNEELLEMLASKGWNLPSNSTLLNLKMLDLPNEDDNEHTMSFQSNVIDPVGNNSYVVTKTLTYKINSSTKQIETLKLSLVLDSVYVQNINSDIRQTLIQAKNLKTEIETLQTNINNLLGTNSTPFTLKNNPKTVQAWQTTIDNELSNEDNLKVTDFKYSLAKNQVDELTKKYIDGVQYNGETKLNWSIVILLSIIGLLLLIIIIMIIVRVVRNKRYDV